MAQVYLKEPQGRRNLKQPSQWGPFYQGQFRFLQALLVQQVDCELNIVQGIKKYLIEDILKKSNRYK